MTTASVSLTTSVPTRVLPIVPVILSGGTGSRLWPVSRSKLPKQFLGFSGNGGGSLLEQTAKRVQKGNGRPMHTPVVVSNVEHRFLVAEHMQRAGYDKVPIILEPEGRNTAPAITAAALYIQSLYKQALMLVLPSDHIIRNGEKFAAAVKLAAKTAEEGHLVTFGITPEYPETGYGYIQQGEQLNGTAGVYQVSKFVEKPDVKTATAYIGSGEYVWNSGMFMFPADLFLEEIKTHDPTVYKHVSASMENAEHDRDFIRLDAQSFTKAPSISVDYAVMEHTTKAAVVPVSCGWSDAGAWDALWRISDKDSAGNVVSGTTFLQDTKDCYMRVEDGPPVAALGIDDLVVISTKDIVLVTRKDRAQDVKQLMEEVRQQNKHLVEHHTRVYRPWGYYESIETGERHQVKHIHVNPGQKLSVQMHHHRAEHWTIVSGTARVFLDGEEKILTQNQGIFIPLGSVHSVENIGKIPLEFIEVQCGDYLGEDDIVRISDMYGRTTGEEKK